MPATSDLSPAITLWTASKEKKTMRRKPRLRPIIPDHMYPLEVAKDHLGWGWRTMKHARGKGLKTHRFGSRVYVVGAELIRIVTKTEGE